MNKQENGRFQFPSNGKGFPNVNCHLSQSSGGGKFSIPFKRERLSELLDKVAIARLSDSVSIPFKRERLSELTCPFVPIESPCLVSIPFKRERLSEQAHCNI